MNADRLLAHYEKITDAPDAIPLLRRFILNLAVRGKLVEQDPNDEPASELLKRITAEKARLVKMGEIRKSKPLPKVDEDTDFGIPSTWRWTRLGVITSYIQRGKSPKYAASDGSPVVSQKCVQWSGLDLTVAKQVTLESLTTYEDIRFLRHGDLLWNSTGTGTIGRVIRLVELPERLVCDSHVTVVRCLEVTPEYIRAWLRSSYVYGLIEERAAGSTNQVELTAQIANNQIVPLPPLAEQHRIVAKVDELMALCERLETARTARETTRDRLAAASLARLDAPDPDPAVFQNHAAFTLDNFIPLTARPDQIKALRQTILNLAVRGKLVPQDPNDEPAVELLKRIAAEKAQLVKEKRTRARRASTPAICSDVPFDLPAGWSPVKIEQILVEIQTGPFGSSLHQSDYQSGGTPVINPASILNERIVPVDKMAVGPVTLERLASFKLRTGDVIMGRRGEMGRCAVVSEREKGWLCGTGSLILRALEYIYPQFLSLLIGSPFSRQYLGGTAVGTTMQNLNQAILLNLSFGIPPLAEQHRIVVKVNELMAYCDQLEVSLATGNDTRRRLLDGLLYGALEETPEPFKGHHRCVVIHGSRAASVVSRASQKTSV